MTTKRCHLFPIFLYFFFLDAHQATIVYTNPWSDALQVHATCMASYFQHWRSGTLVDTYDTDIGVVDEEVG